MSLNHEPVTSNHLCATMSTQYTISQRDVHLYLTTNLFTNFELLISNESYGTTSGPQLRHNMLGKNFYTGNHITPLVRMYVQILKS